MFNDGVGFRYEFPEQTNLTHFIVADEKTQFALSGDHKTFWQPGDYDSNEYLYNTTRLSEIDAVAASNKEKDTALKSVIGPNTIQTPLLIKTRKAFGSSYTTKRRAPSPITSAGWMRPSSPWRRRV